MSHNWRNRGDALYCVSCQGFEKEMTNTCYGSTNNVQERFLRIREFIEELKAKDSTPISKYKKLFQTIRDFIYLEIEDLRELYPVQFKSKGRKSIYYDELMESIPVQEVGEIPEIVLPDETHFTHPF
jgi:hypothetical protein